MNRFRQFLLTAAAVLISGAAAAQSYCDNRTEGLQLPVPQYGTPYHQWSICTRNSFLAINGSSVSVSGSTDTASLLGPIYTPEIGGRSTGTYGVRLSSPLYTLSGGPYFIFRTSGSVEGAGGLGVTYGITAGSVSISGGITASSGTFTGGGGVAITYGLSAATASLSGALQASSASFTASGAEVFSLTTSSGIHIVSGVIKWPDGSTSSTAVTQAGGGGGGGHVIATGTVSGSSVTGRVNLTQEAALILDSAGFDAVDSPGQGATIIKSKGYQYLSSTKTVIVSALSTTGTSWTGVAGSTVSLVTGNNKLLIQFTGVMRNDNGGQRTGVVIFLDGAYADAKFSTTDGCADMRESGGASVQRVPFSCSVVTDAAVSAGTHTISAGWRVDGGTGHLDCDENSVCALNVIELGTGGSGFATSVSTQVSIPEVTFTGSQYACLAGSTMSMTTAGEAVQIDFAGSAATASGGQSVHFGVLQNGAPLNGSGRGFASFANTAGYFNNVSFSLTSTSVPSGLNSWCLWAWNTSSGNTTLYNGSSTPNNRFAARGLRNAPGTGDVSSNGTNGFSGRNTFTGPTTIGASTFTYLSADYTDAASGVCLAGSTITMTTAASKPVRIVFQGSARMTGSGTFAYAEVLMDGSRIDNYTSTRQMWTGSGAITIANTIMGVPINYKTRSAPSSGSHSFCLSFNNASSGGTGHSLNCSTYGECYFEVKEIDY